MIHITLELDLYYINKVVGTEKLQLKINILENFKKTQIMLIYLLYSNWMHNGDNAVNEVIGVYDCLPKAQKALVENIYSDLTSHPYNNIWGNGKQDILKYDIVELASSFYDTPDFHFDVTAVRLWNGEDENYCEDYQHYSIEEREVL